MTAEHPPLEALLARWDRLIWQAALSHARNLGLDPEEVRAEAFVRMCRRFPEFDPDRPNASFTGWALLRVREAAFRMLAVRARSPKTVHVTGLPPWANRSRPEPEFIETAPDPAPRCPLELTAAAEARALVAAAVDRLPAEQREAVRMRFWGGAVPRRDHLRAGLAALREQLAHLDREDP